MKFDNVTMIETLNTLEEAALDQLVFGVVGLNGENIVDRYNTHEARNSGLSRDRVVGRHFFFDVAPCMNNYLVGERLQEEGLDITLAYVLTFRMRPTPVRLRLLHAAGSARRWVLIDRG